MTIGVTGLAWAAGEAGSPSIGAADHYLRPIDGLVDAVVWVTVGSLLVTAVGLLMLVRAAGGMSAVPWPVVVPIVAIGAVLGGGYSVLTAPTVGANIGAGLVLMGAPLLVLVLVVVAVVGARRAVLGNQRAN